MTAPIRVISSMATRHVLNDLAELFQRQFPHRLEIESVGGVVAAKRIQAGEVFDLVVLAADAIDKLAEAGKVVPSHRVGLASSGIAVAVKSGAPHPDISSEAALRNVLASARSISYSTGPSGTHLQQVFARWGMAEEIGKRVVQAPPGVAVGSLVADGTVEIGFQQQSEMIHLQGIDLLGPLPPEVQIVTLFTAALAATAVQIEAARKLLAFMASPELDEIKRRNGMMSV